MSKYNIKHKKQSLADFKNDCHKFSFWYNSEKMEVSCYGAVSVFFSDESIPEDVKCEVQEEIYNLLDKNEYKWSAPKGAKEIADAYCAEEFH